VLLLIMIQYVSIRWHYPWWITQVNWTSLVGNIPMKHI
jgi:hypothetical protein